jgi:hypothetical protein
MVLRVNWPGLIVPAIGLVFAGASPAGADDGLLAPAFQSERMPAAVDSGWITNPASDIAYSQEVRAPGAAWLRLNLDGTVLGGDELGGSGASLRLTSLLDGAVQTMQASHLPQWGYLSAYFNGDAVLVELVMPPGAGASRVIVSEVIYDIPEEEASDPPAPRTYCDTIDNRELSDDSRVARVILSTGAVGTVFMIDDPNHTFLTSGSVAAALNASAVIEFHAPLTYPNGTTLNHPPPEDQYAADLTSIQRVSGAVGSGDNWGYFGANPNSMTGLTPFQSENAFFTLADAIPPADGRSVRTYGNGFTQPPILRTWSYVQKTEVGQYVGFSGTRINFRADLTSGDSGAAVLDETTGEVIGIATDDGCTTWGGSNAGTAVTNPKLRIALNHPLGVCVAIVYNYPNGIPALLNPNGGSAIRVTVTGANGAEPAPGTGQMHYNAGPGWVTASMSEVSPNVYDAVFPGFACGTFVDYYFSAQTTTGIRVPDQLENPVSTFRSVAATSVNVLVNLNFEDATGWDVQNDASLTDGAWERGIPAGNGTRGDPTTDYDGSGKCWLTANRSGDSDVDGGPTRLRSPSYSLAGTSNAFVSYARWFTNVPADSDRLSVQISNNGGLSYTTFDSVADSVGWNLSRFKISSLMPLSSSMRWRFSVSDPGNTSRTEAALDAFSIIDYACAPPCTKGDVDNNGLKDGRDVGAFVSAVFSAVPGSQPFCAADMDGDGVLELPDDLTAFVNCLVNGACP